MLLLGAASRNAGKTGLATEIIRKTARERTVLAAKVTVISGDPSDGCVRGGSGCGACSSLGCAPYLLTEEDGVLPDKDTARLLAAGASRVFWLRVSSEHLDEGRDALFERMGDDHPIVCESNSLRRMVEPDVFLVMRRAGDDAIKPSCRAVLDLADREIRTGPDGKPADPPDLRFEGGRWCLRRDASAVVLAGGQSSRMGRDKALLELDGRSLIERHVHGLAPHFAEVLVSARSAADYADLGFRVVADPVVDQGPMRGVAAALSAARFDPVFITPCDQTVVPVDLATRLLRSLGDADAAVPRHPDGNIEPLLAVLRRRMVARLVAALDRGERRIARQYAESSVRYVDLSSSVDVTNVNTPDEYEAFLRRRSGER